MQPPLSKPCRECPFLRTAPNGYLGAATPENFIQSTLNTEEGMPCHLTVDYDDPDWLDKLDEAQLCRGSLIFLKNSCKLPRSAAYCAEVQAVPADRETVFANSMEFLKHHTAVIQPKKKRRGKRGAD